jgi:hypothetical protein
LGGYDNVCTHVDIEIYEHWLGATPVLRSQQATQGGEVHFFVAEAVASSWNAPFVLVFFCGG